MNIEYVLQQQMLLPIWNYKQARLGQICHAKRLILQASKHMKEQAGDGSCELCSPESCNYEQQRITTDLIV